MDTGCLLIFLWMLAHQSEHCQERMHPVGAAFPARLALPARSCLAVAGGLAWRAGSREQLVMGNRSPLPPDYWESFEHDLA
jgi:hypothetical protein